MTSSSESGAQDIHNGNKNLSDMVEKENQQHSNLQHYLSRLDCLNQQHSSRSKGADNSEKDQ